MRLVYGAQPACIPSMQDIPTAEAVCLKQAVVAKPDLSVVIPVFNSGRFIRETLAAILGQPNLSFEIVLANDGSTDDSLQVVLSFRNPRLTVLELNGNHGASLARNTAIIAGARADWICPFDSDDIMLPDTLAPYFRSVTQKPGAQWGYCMLKLRSDHPAHHGRVMGQPFDLLRFLQRNITCHGMSLYRRDLFMETGGYDPTLMLGGDYDLFLRCLEHSDPVYYPHVNFIYRRHGDNLSTSRPADQTHKAIFGKLRTRLRQPLLPKAALSRNAAFLEHGWLLLEASNQQRWEELLQHAEWLKSKGVESFELDGQSVAALRSLGRGAEALAIALTWIGKMAAGARLAFPEIEWLLSITLTLGRELKRRNVIEAVSPLAEHMLKLSASPPLQRALQSA